jgi:hypothetical protein
MDEITVSLQDWQRLREKAAELAWLWDVVRSLPDAARDAIMHASVARLAAAEGKELPAAYQYEGAGIIHCPGCGRTESKLYLETYPQGQDRRLCPDCRTPVQEIPQFHWDEGGAPNGEGTWTASRDGTANKVVLARCAEGERKRPYGPVYYAPGATRHIRLRYAGERLDLTWQEAYDLGWRLLRLAQRSHGHQPQEG